MLNFKNYGQAELTFCPGINIITGNNGQGKTNILDAIYMLCMTKSYFQYSEKNIVRFGETFFRLHGRFNDGQGMHDIVCKFQLPNKKTFLYDDKEVKKYATFIGKWPIVMIAPNDIYLIDEGSEERRKFLDISICQCDYEYLESLNNYNKILKQRNTYLKQINQKAVQLTDVMDFYNQQMAEISAQIVNKRRSMTDQLNGIYKATYNNITDGAEQATCQYQPDTEGDVDAFIAMLEKNLQKDILLERTTHGIHRDDLEFLLNGQPVKRIGSQGQIKSSVFAAKLAQYHWLRDQKQTSPILLLDDIFDKLDHNRVSRVMQIIDSVEFGQVFITDTYVERVGKILPQLHKPKANFYVKNQSIFAQ